MPFRAKLSASVAIILIGFQSHAQQLTTSSPEKPLSGGGTDGVLIQDWANGDFSIPRIKTVDKETTIDCSNPAYATTQECAAVVIPKINGIKGRILK